MWKGWDNAWTCQIPSNRRISETYTPEKLRWNVGKKHEAPHCQFRSFGTGPYPFTMSPSNLHTWNKGCCSWWRNKPYCCSGFRGKKGLEWKNWWDQFSGVSNIRSCHQVKFTKPTFEACVDHFDPIKESYVVLMAYQLQCQAILVENYPTRNNDSWTWLRYIRSGNSWCKIIQALKSQIP